MTDERRIQFEPFALDLTNECLWKGSEAIRLRPKAFAVLEHLLRRKGRVVSKTELLEHCWDVNFDGAPAVVEVHVHRLRRKIEPPGGDPVIVTVRGGGYMIADD